MSVGGSRGPEEWHRGLLVLLIGEVVPQWLGHSGRLSEGHFLSPGVVSGFPSAEVPRASEGRRPLLTSLLHLGDGCMHGRNTGCSPGT